MSLPSTEPYATQLPSPQSSAPRTPTEVVSKAGIETTAAVLTDRPGSGVGFGWLGRPAEACLTALGRRLRAGRLVATLPDGTTRTFEGPQDGPDARLAIHRWRALGRLLIGGELGFAEAYMAGDWSSPDLRRFMDLVLANEAALQRAFAGSRALQALNWLYHRSRRNTRRGSRRNIRQHYDLGNAFYRCWLDRGMSYSSALFRSEDESLEAAQAAKCARIAELLAPEPHSRVLEIGFGWGGLVETLIRKHDCHVTGITLSREQLAYAEARLDAAGLAPQAALRLQDYRELDGRYDRIVSIEMLEAVGEEHWPVYFARLRDSLRPGGIAVLQVITIADRCFTTYRRRSDFIQRHIFPGGMLPSPRSMLNQIAGAGLVLDRLENFGESYRKTLAEWQRRFQIAWPAIERQGFNMRFKRMWEYYLAYCEAGFAGERLDVGLYRILRPEDC